MVVWNEASSTVCGKGTTLVLAATSCLRAPGFARVVAGLRGDVGFVQQHAQCTVLGRQAFQSLLIHVELQIQATIPPAWVVVERSHLVEAQLQIVVWADPLCGVDGAFFQGL